MSDKPARAQFSQRIQKEVIAAMREARIRPELIYAYEKTGLIILDETGYKRLPSEDRAEYDAAIEEHRARTKKS